MPARAEWLLHGAAARGGGGAERGGGEARSGRGVSCRETHGGGAEPQEEADAGRMDRKEAREWRRLPISPPICRAPACLAAARDQPRRDTSRGSPCLVV